MRKEWVEKRNNDTNRTQMHYARQGVKTEEMAYVASARDSPRTWCATKWHAGG